MIGFVGPKDAVTVATDVASAMSLSDRFISRTYASPDMAGDLAAELDDFCDIIMFAGRWPFRQATTGGHRYRARLQYVSEGAVDLYQVIIGLLRRSGGMIQRISLDTIDEAIVTEVFLELDFTPPTAVCPIDHIDGNPGEVAKRLAAFHLEKLESGEVDVAVTWLRAAYDELISKGAPAYRAQHTRSTYREALNRASLMLETSRSKAGQIVVARVVPGPGIGRGNDQSALGDPSSAKLVQRYAEELRGTIAPSADGYGWLIYTTRGALDNALARYRSGVDSPFVVNGTMPGNIGFGVGPNMAEAINCAARALAASATSNQICIMHSSGLLYSLDDLGTERVISLRAPSGDTAAPNGLGPLSTSRILASLRLLDSSAVTGPQLARAYGVTERSARRLLRRLEELGVATRDGSEGTPGRGRPRVLYRIDVNRLTTSTLQLLNEEAGK